MADQFEEFSGALAPELLARPYRIPGELAWARADAIEAIDALKKAALRSSALKSGCRLLPDSQ
jgi:hypothetical protein